MHLTAKVWNYLASHSQSRNHWLCSLTEEAKFHNLSKTWIVHFSQTFKALKKEEEEEEEKKKEKREDYFPKLWETSNPVVLHMRVALLV